MGDTPAVQFAHRLGQDPLPAAAGPQMVYTLLEVTPVGEAAVETQLPLNVCLLIDQSLSMRGEKIARAREAARYVVGHLGPNDALGIISFNDRATVVVPAALNAGADGAAEALEGILPKGGTELAEGMAAGLEELRRGLTVTGRAISSLLILTDGRTYGDEGRCLALAEEARRQELLITPLGLGSEWNEDLLETVAFRCGSHSQYIDDPEAIERAFRAHLSDLRNLCGRGAELTIATSPETQVAGIHRVSPLIGRVETLPSRRPSEHVVALGNLLLGETQGLLFELVVPPVRDGLVEIARCALGWDSMALPAAKGWAGYQVLAAVDPETRPLPALDTEVKGAVEKVMAYKLQKRAWQDLQDGNVAAATEKLRMVVTRLLEAGEPVLARTVRAEADNLERTGYTSSEGTKQIKYGTRGLGRTHSIRPTEL